jgi:hypothetical protein
VYHRAPSRLSDRARSPTQREFEAAVTKMCNPMATVYESRLRCNKVYLQLLSCFALCVVHRKTTNSQHITVRSKHICIIARACMVVKLCSPAPTRLSRRHQSPFCTLARTRRTTTCPHSALRPVSVCARRTRASSARTERGRGVARAAVLGRGGLRGAEPERAVVVAWRGAGGQRARAAGRAAAARTDRVEPVQRALREEERDRERVHGRVAPALRATPGVRESAGARRAGADLVVEPAGLVEVREVGLVRGRAPEVEVRDLEVGPHCARAGRQRRGGQACGPERGSRWQRL